MDSAKGRSAAGTALHFVVAQIIAHDARRGERADSIPDIERVASALELLDHRTTVELAPFVSTWDPTVLALDESPRDATTRVVPPLREFIDSRIQTTQRNRLRSSDDSRLHEQFDRFVRERVDRIPTNAFRVALARMIRELQRQLVVRNEEELDYLVPLLSLAERSNDPLTIATLNYDLTIETAARKHGVPISRGVSEWQRQGTLRFTGADVDLLKLHGSLDWTRVRTQSSLRSSEFRDVELLERERAISLGPSLVFGQREKLRPAGPFLQLLEEFRSRLAGARHLVIVGYGFRDDHINELVFQWLESTPERFLTIVDPAYAQRHNWGRLSTSGSSESQVTIAHEGADEYFRRLPAISDFDLLHRTFGRL